MSGPTQEAIDTFITVTGLSEAVAVQKLQEHGGDLNAAVNAHFSEGDRSTIHETPIAAQDDFMDVDDPIDVAPRRNPLSILSGTTMNPFSLLDAHFRRSIFDGGSDFMNPEPFVSHPREVREIPIEVKDGGDESSRSSSAPIIEDVTGTELAHGLDIHGTVIVDDDDDDDISADISVRSAFRNEQKDGDHSHGRYSGHGVSQFDSLTDNRNDIEEEMVQAAIEASQQEAQDMIHTGPQQRQFHSEDAELAQAVALSFKAAEQEKTLSEQRGNVGPSEMGAANPVEVELGKTVASNGRLERGHSSVQDEAEDAEEQPLVRHRPRHTCSGSSESPKEGGVIETPPSSPGRNNINAHPPHSRNPFHSDEWGGISSEEHDEAVMLEAAMFGGIPEGTGYHYAYAPHQLIHTEGRLMPRPPSPSLQAQRLIREQQDDEYQASLAADREKEIKAMEKAEALRLQEEAAREAAFEEERQQEEEAHRKLEEEQELKSLLAAKEASLPREPASDDENGITLLVRMPDGTRSGRRFLKSDKLQSLFDFIDVGRVVKPGSYRLVRPYPRHAFSDGESALTLNEAGLTSKQEALFLELI